jgi:hypothetical protein
MFTPDALVRRLDGVFDKDVLVKKMMSDLDGDCNIAYERLSQLLRQHVDV